MEQDIEVDIKHEEMAQAHSEDSQQLEEEVKENPDMNVVFIGHVDLGKSTPRYFYATFEFLFGNEKHKLWAVIIKHMVTCGFCEISSVESSSVRFYS
jgi:hypothetical protein